MNNRDDAEHAAWLADKICNGGDYAKEAAQMLYRWPVKEQVAVGEAIKDALLNYRCTHFADEDDGLPLSDALAAAFGDRDVGRAHEEIELIADAIYNALTPPPSQAEPNPAPAPQASGWISLEDAAEIAAELSAQSPNGDAEQAWLRRNALAIPQPPATQPSDAARDVLAERQRQIEEERWTPEQDDNCRPGELASAAACYVLNAATWLRNKSASRSDYRGFSPINWTNWPWFEEVWKPTSERRDLVKAGALILAELERIDRAATPQAKDAAP